MSSPKKVKRKSTALQNIRELVERKRERKCKTASSERWIAALFELLIDCFEVVVPLCASEDRWLHHQRLEPDKHLPGENLEARFGFVGRVNRLNRIGQRLEGRGGMRPRSSLSLPLWELSLPFRCSLLGSCAHKQSSREGVA
jgi:hypothetical protein